MTQSEYYFLSLSPPPPPPSFSFFCFLLHGWCTFSEGWGLFPQSPRIRPANAINCKKRIKQMKGVVTLQTTRNYFYIQLEKRLKMHFSFDVTSVFFHEFVISLHPQDRFKRETNRREVCGNSFVMARDLLNANNK